MEKALFRSNEVMVALRLQSFAFYLFSGNIGWQRSDSSGQFPSVEVSKIWTFGLRKHHFPVLCWIFQSSVRVALRRPAQAQDPHVLGA